MWLFCILELGCNLMAYSCLYSALWSSEVDSWWTADHNKLELDIKTRWIRLAVPHYAIEVGCHKPMSDWNLTKYPAEIFMMLSCYRKPIHQNHKWVQNSSRKWVHNIYISKQLFQNKVSSGRRTVQCPQTKAVATTVVQWQFHVVKTYKCDTVWQSISDVQKYSTTMSIPV